MNRPMFRLFTNRAAFKARGVKALFLVLATGGALALAGCTKSSPDSATPSAGAPKGDVKDAPSHVDGKMVLLRGNGAEPSDLDPQIVTGVP